MRRSRPAAVTVEVREQIFLADLDGENRFDHLVSSATGVVTAWTNSGQVRKG